MPTSTEPVHSVFPSHTRHRLVFCFFLGVIMCATGGIMISSGLTLWNSGYAGKALLSCTTALGIAVVVTGGLFTSGYRKATWIIYVSAGVTVYALASVNPIPLWTDWHWQLVEVAAAFVLGGGICLVMLFREAYRQGAW